MTIIILAFIDGFFLGYLASKGQKKKNRDYYREYLVRKLGENEGEQEC